MTLTRGSRPADELTPEQAEALRRWDDHVTSESRWSEFAFESRGVRVKVMTDVPELVERLPGCLPPDSTIRDLDAADRIFAIRADPDGFRLTAEVAEVARVADARAALAELTSMLDVAIAKGAANCVFVHGAVVGWGGRAIVLPGRSGSGKTTLVLALVAAGASYYSDEYAVIEDDGRVHAYPRPPGVREDATANTWARRNVIDEGGLTGLPPLHVGLVVVTRYRVATIYRPKVTTAADGVVALMRNTVRVRLQPERTLTTLTRAMAGATVLVGKRGDADRAAASILEFADASMKTVEEGQV